MSKEKEAPFENILAIDTATEAITVALLKGEEAYLKREVGYGAHSQHAIPFIDALLKEADLELNEIDAIAFGAGPGAFTGLRVACGIAQGLGWAREIPLIPVSNLAATAFSLEGSGIGTKGRVLSALDARMHACYVEVFDVAKGEIPKPVTEASLMGPEDIASFAESEKVDFVAGEALAIYKKDIALGSAARILRDTPTDALHIARLGRLIALAGGSVAAAVAAPIYVRNRVALTIDERAKGEVL